MKEPTITQQSIDLKSKVGDMTIEQLIAIIRMEVRCIEPQVTIEDLNRPLPHLAAIATIADDAG